jgi:primosomal replication protein N
LNHLQLSARIAQTSPLRYTPAGIAALNFVLEHESEVLDAVEVGKTALARQVKLTVKALAFGSLAESVGQIELGKLMVFNGFLVNARTSKSLVFHIQSIS